MEGLVYLFGAGRGGMGPRLLAWGPGLFLFDGLVRFLRGSGMRLEGGQAVVRAVEGEVLAAVAVPVAVAAVAAVAVAVSAVAAGAAVVAAAAMHW